MVAGCALRNLTPEARADTDRRNSAFLPRAVTTRPNLVTNPVTSRIRGHRTSAGLSV